MLKQSFFLSILLFSLPYAGIAQDGIKNSEIQLAFPADPENGMYVFSFSDGKLEWRINHVLTLAEALAQEKQQKKSHNELLISLLSEYSLNGSLGTILSKEQFDTILKKGSLPDMMPMQKAFEPDLEHIYVLKSEIENAYYIFRLRDASKRYTWQEIQYIRIPEGQEWKQNPDLLMLNDTKSMINGLKTVIVSASDSVLPNLAKGQEKRVSQNTKDLKEFFPAAAKEGDIYFVNRKVFRKELAKAGCDYFDEVKEYPIEGEQLMLCLNKRCVAIPEEYLESLCDNPEKLVGDYCGIPMDISDIEQPMVLLETPSKQFFLIVGVDTSSRIEITYLEIPQNGISKEQLKAICEYRSLQRKKNLSDITFRRDMQEYKKKLAERNRAEVQAMKDKENEEVKKLIESMKSSQDIFPKTSEEIQLVERLIVEARLDDFLQLCEGKKMDFSIVGKFPLLYDAIELSPQYHDKDFLNRKNRIMEFMLKNGGSELVFTDIGFACVRGAIRTNNKDVLSMFLENGYDLNQKNKNGETVLDSILGESNNIDSEIMNLLQEKTKPSVFTMIRQNDAAGLKKALEDKDNLEWIKKKDSNGKTLLNHVLQMEKTAPAVVHALLVAGVEFGVKDMDEILLHHKNDILPIIWEFHDRLSEKDWNECFNMSATYQNTEAFQFFLEKGLDPKKQEGFKCSPLINAYERGTKEMVDMLDARGFKKPFWAAVRWNDINLAKEYLATGVDVNADDKITRCNPIRLAVTRNHLEMAELLIQHGANISPDDYRRNGQTYPVATAARMENGSKMMELLLKNGFFPDFPETPEDTKKAAQSSALYMALYKKQYETAKVLLKYGARTDVTQNKTVRNAQGQPEHKDATLEEVFQNDPEALKVLGAK